MGHSPRLTHHHKKRGCTSTSLYTYPTASDTVPVYETLSLEWATDCSSLSGQVDIYLSVLEDTGYLAVREWTGATYSSGKLETQLQPGWWNASTGAGSVSAQLAIVPTGQPSWNSPVGSGPIFTISYNGTYPSVTTSAYASEYTGPSVQSVENKTSSSPSGGKLGAAVAIPILALGLIAAAYVIWNKKRKRPEKKRFSAVVDQRMSMISQGTWQPRPSMASGRPGSTFVPGHRPSGSQYSAFPNAANRDSTYSFSSPLAGGIRPPPPVGARDTGSGERTSRISFAAGEGMPRPSMASSRHAAKPSSIHTRSSLHQSQLRNSTFLADSVNQPLPSPGIGQHSPNLSRSASSPPTSPTFGLERNDYFSRSGTQEELASLRSQPSNNSLNLKPSPFGHAHKASHASSLRNELSSLPALAVVRDGSLAYSFNPSPTSPSPFNDPNVSPSGSATSLLSSSSTPLTRPKPTLASLSTENLRPTADLTSMPSFRSSTILSPDQALASYARDAVSPIPGARGSPTPPPTTAGKGGIARSAGMLFARPAAMLRSLTGSSLNVMRSGANTPVPPLSPGLGVTEEKQEKHEEYERARSPFVDPVEEEGQRGLGVGLGVAGLRPHSTAQTEASRYSTASESPAGTGQAM